MRATETIYREMLVAYAKRRGGQLQEDCDLSVRLWAAAAPDPGVGGTGGMGAGAELSPDGCGGLSGPPRSHARHCPAGLQQGDPRSVDLSAVQRTDRRGERGDRNGVHDGGNCPVPDYGAGDDPGWGDFGDRGGGGRGDWQQRERGSRSRSCADGVSVAVTAVTMKRHLRADCRRKRMRNCGSGFWTAFSGCPMEPTPHGMS